MSSDNYTPAETAIVRQCFHMGLTDRGTSDWLARHGFRRTEKSVRIKRCNMGFRQGRSAQDEMFQDAMLAAIVAGQETAPVGTVVGREPAVAVRAPLSAGA